MKGSGQHNDKERHICRLTTQAARMQANFCDGIAFADDTHRSIDRVPSPSTATRIVPLVAAAAHAAHAVVKGLPRLELVGVQGGLDRGDSCHATPQEQTWGMNMNTGIRKKSNDGADEKI